MKKLLSLILALTMLLSVCMLTSCNFGDDADDGDEEGSESLALSETEAKEKIASLASGDGYSITYRYSTGGDAAVYTVGEKGDIFWVMSGDENGLDEGTAYLTDGENSISAFSYDEDDGWEFAQSLTSESAAIYRESLALVYGSWLYRGNVYDGSLKKTGEGKVAGRNCVNYSFTYDYGILAGGLKYQYNLSVDKETGVTLALHMNSKYQGETASMDYEVTEFLTGSAVKLPELPEVVSIYDLCGLTLDDIKTSVGVSTGTVMATAQTLSVSVKCADSKFITFSAWLDALADNCREAANDGKIYEDEYTEDPIASFDLDSGALINMPQFIYRTDGYVVYVTASSYGMEEGSFSAGFQVYED